MSVFEKAKDKAASSESQSNKKKATVWQVVNAAEAAALDTAIHEIVLLQADSKAIAAKQSIFKSQVKKHAEERYLHDYAELGVAPDSPMQLVNGDGEKVTYVVQERCSQSKVKSDQAEQLASLLGEDGAKAILFENTVFKFNDVLLARDGVMAVVGAALDAAFKTLVKEEVVTKEESDALLEVDEFVAFKPGTTSRLADICGRDTQKMKGLLDIMGSASVRYIKA